MEEKEKKPLIKRIKNKLKMAIAGLLVGVTITTGAAIYANVEYKDYLTDSEIESVAETLDCDTGYLSQYNGHYIVLKHNDDEPIYVCFDEEYTEEDISYATESLDYVFGLVGKINPKYRYEIIDKSEYNKKLTKSKIYFSYGKHAKTYEDNVYYSNAYIVTLPSLLSHLTNKRTFSNCFINLDKDAKLKSSDQKKNIFTHEILHAFGFKDVYTVLRSKTTDKYQGNTFMLDSSSKDIQIITPNDFKCLISLYKDDNLSEDYIKKLVKDYSNYYYNVYSKTCKSKLEDCSSFEDKDFKFENTLEITEMDGTKHGYIYEIEVKDGVSYDFYIYDLITGKELDFCSGKVIYKNGTTILKDVSLTKGLRPRDTIESYAGGFIQDLIFIKSREKVVLYDLNTNDVKFGMVTTLEKEMTR